MPWVNMEAQRPPAQERPSSSSERLQLLDVCKVFSDVWGFHRILLSHSNFDFGKSNQDQSHKMNCYFFFCEVFKIRFASPKTKQSSCVVDETMPWIHLLSSTTSAANLLDPLGMTYIWILPRATFQGRKRTTTTIYVLASEFPLRDLVEYIVGTLHRV